MPAAVKRFTEVRAPRLDLCEAQVLSGLRICGTSRCRPVHGLMCRESRHGAAALHAPSVFAFHVVAGYTARQRNIGPEFGVALWVVVDMVHADQEGIDGWPATSEWVDTKNCAHHPCLIRFLEYQRRSTFQQQASLVDPPQCDAREAKAFDQLGKLGIGLCC